MSVEDRDRLVDAIGLLEASLRDAKGELDRGDLDRASFDIIWARDTERLERARRDLDDLEHLDDAVLSARLDDKAVPLTDDESPRRSRRGVVAALLVACAGVLVVVLVVATRGSPSSGTSTITSAQVTQIESLLSRASTDVEAGRITAALPIYAQVLAIDPHQPEALAQSGWLTFEAGAAAKSTQLIAKGQSEIEASVAADPNLFASRLYLGVVDLLADRDPASAMRQFKVFLSLKPSVNWVRQAQPYIDKAASELKVPVPTT